MEYKVSEILNIISGGTPRRNNNEYWNGDIPWLTVKDFNNDNRLVHDTQEKITMKGLENSSATLVSKGTVVISARGTVGELCQVAKSMTFNQSCFGLEAKTKYTTNEYIYYWFKYKINYVKNNTHGSVFDTINRKTFENLYINLPNIRYQNKVVNILRYLDNKIENNKQIIKNLEDLSETLFKRWFVDFEFLDENGNPYKSSGGEMIDSELGEIPEGWSLGNFENLGKIVGGGTPSKKVSEYYTKQKEIPWITPKDLSKNKNTYIYHGEQDITELGLNKSSAKLINKDSVLFSSRAPIGYIAIAGQEVTTNQGFKSIEVDKNINPYYVFFLLKYKLPIIEQTASGSTFKEISSKGMKSIPIILPIIETINKYGNIVESYFEKIKILEKENQKLIQLRDTLLPKLMSGEIEIPDDIEVNEDELSI